MLRTVLSVPGRLVEWLDGTAVPGLFIDQDKLYALVAATARHPESRLALESDMHHVVQDGNVLAYQVRGRTAFAVAGLNARPAERIDLLAAYQALPGVRRHLIFPLRRSELRDAIAVDFSPIQVGIEAVVDLPNLAFDGKAYRTVRNMRNRAGRRGVRVHEVRPHEYRAELEQAHARWLEQKRPSWRMKLLVGSPCLDMPHDRRYLAAFVDDAVVGFITLLPGGPGQWGLDVMAQVPEAPSGTMDLLLAHACEQLRDEGAATLSLGACPMAGIPLTGKGWLLRRIFRVLYASSLGNRVFGFRRLHQFKSKFRPRWEPVYFAASPRLGIWSLYLGCRMWGLY
ncbi:MAG: phosphatidylglycerol lysyltransferase [Myxococcota bacterium]